MYIGAHHRLNFKEKDVAKIWPVYKTLGLFVAVSSGPNSFRAERNDSIRPPALGLKPSACCVDMHTIFNDTWGCP